MRKIGRCSSLSGALNTKCFKIINIECYQIDGWDGETYIQHDKYPPLSKKIYSQDKIEF